MLKRGRSLKIHEMEVDRAVKFQDGHNGESHQSISAAPDDLVAMFGTDGTSSFVNLLYEQLLQFDVTSEIARHTRLSNPASAYI